VPLSGAGSPSAWGRGASTPSRSCSPPRRGGNASAPAGRTTSEDGLDGPPAAWGPSGPSAARGPPTRSRNGLAATLRRPQARRAVPLAGERRGERETGHCPRFPLTSARSMRRQGRNARRNCKAYPPQSLRLPKGPGPLLPSSVRRRESSRFAAS
jgi:hypothetical protein